MATTVISLYSANRGSYYGSKSMRFRRKNNASYLYGRGMFTNTPSAVHSENIFSSTERKEKEDEEGQSTWFRIFIFRTQLSELVRSRCAVRWWPRTLPPCSHSRAFCNVFFRIIDDHYMRRSACHVFSAYNINIIGFFFYENPLFLVSIVFWTVHQ